MNQIVAAVLPVAFMLLEAQLVNGLSCALGSNPPGLNNTECPASATYCGLTQTTSDNGEKRFVASCEDDVVACDQLCAGVPNCWSACCNNEPNCNVYDDVSKLVNGVTCMTGSTTNGTVTETKTCESFTLCARREVTTDGVTTTTGMCSTYQNCNLLCANFTNCVSACCYDADECNVRPVSDINNIVRCATKHEKSVFQYSTCAPGFQCGRIEEGNQTVMEVSCQTAAACDAGLCGNRTNCVAACCQNDACNLLSVAELNVGVTWTATTTTATTTKPTTTTAATTPTTTSITTEPTTTTTATKTTSGAKRAAQINILMMMCLVVFGCL